MPRKTIKFNCPDCGAEVETWFATRQRCCACASKRTSRAYPKVAAALKAGRLIRQPCEVCGATKVDAHHDDYSQPLNVRWLCRRHHQQHHAAEYRAARAT